MKYLLALLFSVAALHVFAASPAATRDWVRSYVATNVSSRTERFDTTPIRASITNDQGEAEIITVNFEIAANEGLVVTESSVIGMSVGTRFAKTDAGTYVNNANPCGEITGKWERFNTILSDGYYQYVTNGASVATNVIYRTTNEVWMTRYTAVVDNVTYKSSEVRKGYHLFTSDNGSRFYMREVKLTNAEKKALTESNLLSRLSLDRVMDLLADIFIPRAYAYTIGPHETTRVEEYTDKRITYWEAHLFTDGSEAQKITVESVTITSSNGQQMTYELGITILDIGYGVDFCDLKNYAIPEDDEILAAIEEAVGRNRAIQLSRSQEWVEYLADKLDKAKEILAALQATTCPMEGEEEEEIEQPPDEPIPEPEHVCQEVEGSCGHWYCVQCRKVYEAFDENHPSSHSYAYPESKMCKQCVYCGSYSPSQGDHGGWHNVNLNPMGPVGAKWNACGCECGRFAISHTKGETIRYDQSLNNPLVCWEVWRCARCGEVVEANGPVDSGTTMTATTHDETTNGKFSAVTVGGREICRLAYTCAHLDASGSSLGCGAQLTEDLFHVIGWNQGAISSQGDENNHVVKYPCVNGFAKWSEDADDWGDDNPAWCGHCMTTNKPHHWSDVVKKWNDPRYPANRQGHKHLYVCGSTYTLKGDGVTTCGKVIVSNEEHEVTATYYGDPNATTHAVSNKCGKCFGLFLATDPESGREPHESSGSPFYYPLDIRSHAVSNYCMKCDTVYYVGTSNHVFDSVFKEYGYLDGVSHAVSNTCRICNMKVLVDVEPHESSPYALPTYTYADEATHLVSNRCIKCGRDYPDTPEQQAHIASDQPGLPPFQRSGEWTHTCSNVCAGCGHAFFGSESCDAFAAVSLGDGDSDFEVCMRCGNTRTIAHHFVPDGDESHHCSNGEGHLYEDHVWGEDNTNVCVKCGWDREEHRRPDPELWTTNYCANCSGEIVGDKCFAVFKNGIYQEPYSHCAAGWNLSAGKCGCFACMHNLTYGCTCKWDNLMQGSNGDHLPAEWTFSGSN